ncbi:MAG: FAD:protein FMN transferase, partial [Planctomycetota bacterium]
ASRLREEGVENFMMHGGLSSITAAGNRRGSQNGWSVALKHPWRWEEELGTIRLRDRSLGTSGSGKQFFHFGGERYSHIIDPRTGWPAQGMMSTTVICPSAAVADSLATAFIVMGREQTVRFCEQHQDVAAVLVYQDTKSGRQRIQTCNVDRDDWTPAGA